MPSLNKQQHVTFEYDNFSERGLSKFLRMIATAGAGVASVTASNRKIKKDGLYTKKATFFFEGGQRAEVVIGDAGDVVSLKINGKATPFKGKSQKDFAKSIVALVDRGQAAFDKSLAKKLKNVKATSSVRLAATPIKKKIEEATKELVDAEENQQKAQAELDAINARIEQRENTISTKQSEFDQAKAFTAELRQQLAELEG